MRMVTHGVPLRRRAAGRVVCGAAVVLAIVSFIPRVTHAAPLADYDQRLGRAIEIADNVYGGDTSVPLSQIGELLPPHETIEYGNQSVDVDNSWLAAAIAQYDGSTDTSVRTVALNAIVTRLYAMSSAITMLDKAPEHATPEDRDRLEKILKDPEFRPPAEDPLAVYLRDLRRRIFEFLARVLQKLFGGQQSSSYTSGLRIIIVAVGAVALFVLGRAIVQAVARRKPGRRRAKKVVLGEEVDESTTSDDLVTAARALASSGDYRGAIRKLFVALIYELDERGVVTLRSEATNREYLALVRDAGRLYPVMTAMTDVFERVWYGQADVDRIDFDEFERLHSQARSAFAAPAVN